MAQDCKTRTQVLWNWMNARKSRFFREIHGRCNMVAGDAFMDGAGQHGADRIYRNELIPTFFEVLKETVGCWMFGHKWEKWETGNRETGPKLHARCLRCDCQMDTNGWI